MKSRFAFLRLYVLPALACFAAAWLLSHTAWLREVENTTLDFRTRSRVAYQPPADERIVVAGIDDHGLQNFGQWPWPREVHGVFMFVAAKKQAAVVAWDVMFIEPDTVNPSNDDKLVRYTQAAMSAGTDSVYAAVAVEPIPQPRPAGSLPLTQSLGHVEGDISLLEGDEDMDAPLAALQDAAHMGFVNAPPEADGMRRYAPLVVRVGKKVYASLSLETLIRYWKLSDDDVRVRLGDGIYLKTAERERRIPIDERGRYFINYRLGEETANFGSYSKMVKNFTAVEIDKDPDMINDPKGNLKGKIVLVGQHTTALTDNGPTPFHGKTPLVLFHANVIENVLREDFARAVPAWIVGLVGAIVGIVSTWMLRAQKLWARATCGLGVPTLYVGVTMWAWAKYSAWLPLVWPVLGFAALQVHGIVLRLIAEQRAKEQIKGMFGTYLSPTVVNRLVDSGETPRLGGHKENITAYFSDIEGFSTFSEILPPERLVELLNEYLTACTDLIQEEGGTLDKYIGDAVVAMYGAPIKLPDHAYRACVTALRVQKKIGELRQKWREEGNKWPELVWRMRSRIGLNSGDCVIGNMGSRSRFAYTMMGDDVNLAARMESGAKKWGVFTMCTEATKLAAEQHGGDRIVFRALGRIKVKGRDHPTSCYEIVGLKEDVSAETHQCIALFEAGLNKYFARDWAGALELFAQSEPLELHGPSRDGGTHNPSLIYAGIVHDLRAESLPSGWDGVQEMKEK